MVTLDVVCRVLPRMADVVAQKTCQTIADNKQFLYSYMQHHDFFKFSFELSPVSTKVVCVVFVPYLIRS